LEVTGSERLMESLRAAIRRYCPRVVIETGTYLGTGSTRMIAEAFAPDIPEKFYTIEISSRCCEIARRNLAHLEFVEVVRGLSVDRQQAENFIRNDSFLWEAKRHGIEVEQPKDPVGFYLNEIRRRENGAGAHEDECYPDPVKVAPDNLLARLLPQYRDRQPLIALDSAGGIGWLEFQEVLRLQAGFPFVLFLDDINHVKHYRSLKYVESCPEFYMIDCNVSHGWMLAAYESSQRAVPSARRLAVRNSEISIGSRHSSWEEAL
jgi:hypothetical protein